MSITIVQTSCKKFVQVEPPSNQLTTQTVFDNDLLAVSAQTAIYSQMATTNSAGSLQLSLKPGLLSDELEGKYSQDAGIIQAYTNSMVAANAQAGPWSAYFYIYQCNAIIEALEKSKGVHDYTIKQLTGESKFLRAFWLFYLTNCYGDIPLVTTTDYTNNGTIARSSKAQVYDQIVSDLHEAEGLLSANYLDASDTTITTERVRPTVWAARALLARVYLYTSTPSYDSAEANASAVINNTGLYNLQSNLNDVFLANSSEAIWQLQTPLPSTINTKDGQNFILIKAPSGGANNTATISPILMNSFEVNDQRKTNWIDSFTNGTDTYYFPFKYQVYDNNHNPNGRTEYTMVLRLAEQYLIRSEARAQLGNTQGALEDLNAIRRRAGLGDYTGATDKNSLLAGILHERQVELFTEWGHRWFDLIRTGNINAVMGAPGNVTLAKGGNWGPDGHQSLFPIPQSERLVDPNLTQNPGYN